MPMLNLRHKVQEERHSKAVNSVAETCSLPSITVKATTASKKARAKRFQKERFIQEEAEPLNLPHIPRPPSEPRRGLHRTFGGYVNLPEITDTTLAKPNPKPTYKNCSKQGQAILLPPIERQPVATKDLKKDDLIGERKSPSRNKLPMLNAVNRDAKAGGDMTDLLAVKPPLNPKPKTGKEAERRQRLHSNSQKSGDKTVNRKSKSAKEEKRRIERLVKEFDDLVRAPLEAQN